MVKYSKNNQAEPKQVIPSVTNAVKNETAKREQRFNSSYIFIILKIKPLQRKTQGTMKSRQTSPPCVIPYKGVKYVLLNFIVYGLCLALQI